MAITINNFKGASPRLAPHLIDANQGSLVIDCKLTDGCISAFNERQIYTKAVDNAVSLQWVGDVLVTSDKMIDVAQTRVGSKRHIVTGYKDYPVNVDLNSDGSFSNVYRLGVPQPTNTLTVNMQSSDGAPERSKEGRAYAYAYYNRYGEIGALSPPVYLDGAYEGVPVTVSGWVIPDTEYGVTEVHIFKAVSAVGSSMPMIEPTNPFDTVWVLVGEVSIYDTNDFIDDVWNDQLTRSYVDLYHTMPPDGLSGVVAIPDLNMLAGYCGNRVYLSTNDSYHNWREYFDLDSNVCMITATRGFVYVVTGSRAYTIAIKDPATSTGNEIIRHNEILPAVACGNDKIIALADDSAVYISTQGLVAMKGATPPSVITDAFFSHDLWLSKAPNSMSIIYQDERVFCFGKHYSFCIHTSTGWDNDKIVELSDLDVVDTSVSPGGVLSLLAEDGLVYLWDRGDVKRPYKWYSKVNIVETPIMFGAYALRVSDGAVSLQVKVDGSIVSNDFIVSDTKGLLPMYSYGNTWVVMIEGVGSVKTVTIAPSLQELP